MATHYEEHHLLSGMETFISFYDSVNAAGHRGSLRDGSGLRYQASSSGRPDLKSIQQLAGAEKSRYYSI